MIARRHVRTETGSGAGPRLTGSSLRTYLAFTRASAAAFGVLQLSVLARLLPGSEYAVAATTIAVAAYVQLIGEPALAGYQRLGSHRHGDDSSPGGARSSAFTVLLVVALMLPLGGAVWGVLAGQLAVSVAGCLWVLSIVQMSWASIQYLNWNHLGKFGTLQLVNSGTRTVFLSAGAWAFRDAAAALLLGAAASILVTLFVGPARPPLSRSWRGIRDILAVGGPMAVAAAAGTSVVNWPTIVGSQALPTLEFASFAAQSALANAAYGTVVGFVLVFGFPVAKREWDSGDHAAAWRVVKKYLTFVAVLGPVIAASFWFLGDWATALLLGEAYSGHAIPTAMIAWGCINSISLILGWGMRLQYRQSMLAAVTVAAAVIQVPLVWWSASHLGVPGLLAGMGVVAVGQVAATFAVAKMRGWSLPAGIAATMSAVLVVAAASA